MSKKNQVVMNPVINYPVDQKSQQVVNTEIPVAQLGRTKIKGGEPFNEITANSLLEKHLKKKKKTAPAIFLVDRIRFTKKGFHEYLNYREIQNFQKFQHHPDKFMLYVVEEKKGRRSYESYACGSPADVSRIRDLIAAAQNDPKRLLQDSGPTRMLSVSSSSSSEYHVDVRSSRRSSRPSINYHSQHVPEQSYYVLEQPQYVVEQPQYILQPAESRSVYRTSYIQPADDQFETVKVPSVRASQIYEAPKVVAPANDVTYLRSDNIHGPQVMDQGPVYMYVARSRPSAHQKTWSPDAGARHTYY